MYFKTRVSARDYTVSTKTHEQASVGYYFGIVSPFKVQVP